MNYAQKIDLWAEGHQSKGLALLRIVLGLVIFLKGVFFIMNTDALQAMIANSAINLFAVGLVHIVACAHLMGGLLIMLGLITRIAIAFQIPILLGAVLFVNAQRGFFSIHSELSLSIFVLTMLIFFLIYGSGPLSVDKWMKDNRETDH